MTFTEYVELRAPALIRFARLLTGDDHLAQDVVQSSLAKLYLRWSRVERAEYPDLYVRKTIVNTWRGWHRKRSGKEVVTADLLDRPHPHDFSAAAADRDQLWRLIQQLPDKQRAVIVLRYYEDLDDAAIAEVLECSPVTVRTNAMRALNTLRAKHETTAVGIEGGRR